MERWILGTVVHFEVQPQAMKIVRYAAVGLAAAITDFLIFAIFAKFLGFNYLLVGAAGFIIATTINYFLSIRFVFESGIRFKPGKEIALVFLISLVGLGVNQSVLYLGIGILGFNMLLTKIGATGMVFFWNFGARSNFVFKRMRNQPVSEAEIQAP